MAQQSSLLRREIPASETPYRGAVSFNQHLVRRRVLASTKAAALEVLSAWPGLCTMLAVETIRSVNGTDKVESEIRYFLSSGADDPATLGAAIRTH